MKTHPWWIALAGLAAMPVYALDAVVGDGTPASCNEFAFEQALLTVQNSGGGTIHFSCGADPQFIVLTSRKTLLAGTIIDGGGLITFTGLNATGLFAVPDAQTSVELRHVGLKQGRAITDFGGAIQLGANSTLRLLDTQIYQCSADFSGGAIHTQTGSTLHVEDSYIAQNQAGNGGAIAANGTINLINSLIAGNLATLDQGGGIQVWFGQLQVMGTRFSVNSATNGGALLLRGTVASITDTSFDENTATERGGAIALYENAVLQGNGLNFTDNHGGMGGALHLGGSDDGVLGEPSPSAQVVLSNSVFQRNDADDGGAAYIEGPNPLNAGGYGLLWTEDSGFVDNLSRGHGGAVLSFGQARFTDTHFTANRAEQGGALSLLNTWISSLSFQWGFTAMERVRFDSNHANMNGGAIFGGGVPVFDQVSFVRNYAAQTGGAIAVTSAMPVIAQASFVDNSAQIRGGAISIRNAHQELLNLSFSGNQVIDAAGSGSDIHVYGDRTISGSARLTHVTLIGSDDDAGAALAVSDIGGRAWLYNSIVSAAPGAFACGSINITSDGGNAIPAECGAQAPSDWVINTFADLQLSPLSNNGSFTAGFIPLIGSGLIDALDVDCPSERPVDQRGIATAQDGDNNGEARCDIGALERRPAEPGANYATFRNGFE